MDELPLTGHNPGYWAAAARTRDNEGREGGTRWTSICNHGYITIVEPEPTPDERPEWVMLVYRIPREPSTPRIAVWRKLRKHGVFQLADGVVVLPASPRTREQFDWMAEEVVEAGGQAEVWTAVPTTKDQRDRMRAKLSADRAAEYDEITDTAEAARSLPDPDGRTKKLTQLRRRMREIDKRTFYPTPQRDRAEAALKELATGRAVETQVSR